MAAADQKDLPPNADVKRPAPNVAPPGPDQKLADLPLCHVCHEQIAGLWDQRRPDQHHGVPYACAAQHIFHPQCILAFVNHAVRAAPAGQLPDVRCPICRELPDRARVANLALGLRVMLNRDNELPPPPDAVEGMPPVPPAPDVVAVPPPPPAEQAAGPVNDEKKGDRKDGFLRVAMAPFTPTQLAEMKRRGIQDHYHVPAHVAGAPQHAHQLSALERRSVEHKYYSELVARPRLSVVAFNGDANRWGRIRGHRVMYDSSPYGRRKLTDARADRGCRLFVCDCAARNGLPPDSWAPCQHVPQADVLWFACCGGDMDPKTLAQTMSAFGAQLAVFFEYNLHECVGSHYAGEISWSPVGIRTFKVKVGGDVEHTYRRPAVLGADAPVSIRGVEGIGSLHVSLLFGHHGGDFAPAWSVFTVRPDPSEVGATPLTEPHVRALDTRSYGPLGGVEALHLPAGSFLATHAGSVYGRVNGGAITAIPRDVMHHVISSVQGKTYTDEGLAAVATDLYAYVNGKVNNGELKVAGWPYCTSDLANVLPLLVRMCARVQAQAAVEAARAVPVDPVMSAYNALMEPTRWTRAEEYARRAWHGASANPISAVIVGLAGYYLLAAFVQLFSRYRTYYYRGTGQHEYIPITDMSYFYYLLRGNPDPVVVGSLFSVLPFVAGCLYVAYHNRHVARWAAAFAVLAVVFDVAVGVFTAQPLHPPPPPPPPPSYTEAAVDVARLVFGFAGRVAGEAAHAASNAYATVHPALSSAVAATANASALVVHRAANATYGAAENVHQAAPLFWQAFQALFNVTGSLPVLLLYCCSITFQQWAFGLFMALTVFYAYRRRPVTTIEIDQRGVSGFHLGPLGAYGKPPPGCESYVAWATQDAESIRPDPEQDPRARISVRPKTRRFRTRVRFNGPVSHGLYTTICPTAFANSFENQLKGLKARVCSAKNWVHPETVGSFLTFATAFVCHEFDRVQLQPMNVGEYVTRYPAEVGRRLLAANRRWRGMIRHRPILRTRCIVKRENGKPTKGILTGNPKVRMVAACSPERNVVFGPVVVPAKDELCRQWGPDNWLVAGPGLTSEQLGRAVTGAAARPHVVHECDVAMYETSRPNWSCYPWYWLLHRFGLSGARAPDGKRVLDLMRQAEVLAGTTKDGVRYKAFDDQTSGDAATTGANTAFTGFVWAFVLWASNPDKTWAAITAACKLFVAGDDSLLICAPHISVDYEWFKRLGLKMEVHVRERVEDATFCSCRFYWAIVDGVRMLMPGPKITRIYTRLGWFLDLGYAAGTWKADGVLRGVAIGMLHVGAAVPEVLAYCRLMLRVTAGRRPLHHRIRSRDFRPAFRSTAKRVVPLVNAPRHVPVMTKLIKFVDSAAVLPLFYDAALITGLLAADGFMFDTFASSAMRIAGSWVGWLAAAAQFALSAFTVYYTLFVAHRLEEWVHSKSRTAFLCLMTAELWGKLLPATDLGNVFAAGACYAAHVFRNGNYAERVRSHQLWNRVGIASTLFGLPVGALVLAFHWRGARGFDRRWMVLALVAGVMSAVGTVTHHSAVTAQASH